MNRKGNGVNNKHTIYDVGSWMGFSGGTCKINESGYILLKTEVAQDFWPFSGMPSASHRRWHEAADETDPSLKQVYL